MPERRGAAGARWAAVVSALFSVAVLAAVFVVGVRFLRRHASERRQPGRSPERAIPIEDYGEIDIAVRSAACACGGRFVLRGEAPVDDPTRSLRVAVVECRRCERERRLFFDLSTIRN